MNSSPNSKAPLVSTQTKDPWAPTQPYLMGVLPQAQSLYSSDTGYKPYNGPTSAGLDGRSVDALNASEQIARGGDPLGVNAYNATNSMVQNQGLNSGLLGAAGTMRGIANSGGLGTDPLYGNIYNMAGQNGDLENFYGGMRQADPFSGVANNFGGLFGGAVSTPSAAQQNLSQMASGEEGIDPRLNRMFDDNAARITSQAASKLSGSGRFGSNAAFADMLGRNITAANDPIAFQASEAAKGRQLAATGQIDAARNANFGQALSALQGQQGAIGNNIESQMAGAASQAGLRQSNANQMLGAAQGLTNARNAGTQNSLNAATQEANIYGQGLNREMSAAQMAPQAYQNLFSPSQVLSGIGDVYQGQEQSQINDLLNYWNAAEARPWEQLARENGIFSGLGALGGTQVNTKPDTSPATWQKVLGGAVAGGGLLSKFIS